MRRRSGAKAVSDQDVVRAAAATAALDQWQSAISMADLLAADDAKLDALSRVFVVWEGRAGSR
jgi:hypothetical protein